MSVILRTRKNVDGTTRQFLDVYNKGVRKREFLNHLKLCKPANPADRESNKSRVKQAAEIAVVRASELQANDYNMTTEAGKKVIVTVWMQSFVDGYKKADVRTVQGVLNRFTDFLKEGEKPNLTFGHLTALVIEDFIQYLELKGSGEGASSYFKRFKKMIKQAFRQRLLKENPLDFVDRKVRGKAGKKDVLTIAEIEKLAATETSSPEVRRAFLFSCTTGLRWKDIKEVLKWKHIDLENKVMNITQGKTNEELSSPLNDTALELLGSEKGKPGDLIFDLPSQNGANKTLKAWVKRAGIEKKITWHNARHSFGTNLIFNGIGVLTASQLLGHTSLKHTQRYVNTSREMKEDATKMVTFKITAANEISEQ